MVMPKFNSDFFKGNRKSLKRMVGDTPIAVTANGLIQRGADSSYQFSQDANFWYLTGINNPDVILVMDGGREFLIVPIREGSRVTFDGQIDQKQLSSISGIEDIVNEVTGWKRLDSLLEKNKQLATLAPAPLYIEQYGMYSNPARARFIERLSKHVSELELIDIRPELARLRMIKQGPEIAAIKSAVSITTETIKDIIAKPYGSYGFEYQIEADITQGFRYRGALGHAFEPIVASGDRACVLHNVTNSGRLDVSELVVIDVGANVNGYSADITRTIPTSSPTKRQKDIFAAVKETQSYAFEQLKPGIHLKTFEQKIVKFIGNKLKELKVTKDLKESTVRQYFPHATSHFLGLNVHDVGDYQKPLTKGIVLTVEPGIYIPEERIGVRIEDDVLLTENGIEILSRNLPTRL